MAKERIEENGPSSDDGADADSEPNRYEKPATVSADDKKGAPSSRRIFLYGLAAGLTLGGAAGWAGHFWYYRLWRRRRRGPSKPRPPAFVPIATYNPRRGPNPAKVTIIEFSDFQ